MPEHFWTQEKAAIIRLMREYHDPLTAQGVYQLLTSEMATTMTEKTVSSMLSALVRDGSPIVRLSRGLYQYHSTAQENVLKIERDMSVPPPLPEIKVLAEDTDLLVLRYKGRIWIAKPGKE